MRVNIYSDWLLASYIDNTSLDMTLITLELQKINYKHTDAWLCVLHGIFFFQLCLAMIAIAIPLPIQRTSDYIYNV